MIRMKYEVGAGLLAVGMRFTRVVVAHSDATAVSMINKIKYSIDHLLIDDAVNQLTIGSSFLYNSCIYCVHSIAYGAASCSLDEGTGAPSIELPVAECIQLVNQYNL